MQQKVILTIGLPASGKTTWSYDLMTTHHNIYKRVNKDDLRSMVDNSKHSKTNEILILELRDLIINKFLLNGYSVIVDDTNLNPIHNTNIQNLIDDFNKKHNTNIILETKFFNTPVEECVFRDSIRQKQVGSKVIYTMYNTYNSIYNFDGVQPIEQDNTLPKAIIVDVDGTIAKNTTRHFYDWEKVDEDLPKTEIIDIVKMFYMNGYKIIFLSGRDSICYDLTYEWIKRNVNIDSFELYQRKLNDVRGDEIIKKELFYDNIYGKYYITQVFDDRNKVVNMWRQLGLTCLQVERGNF